jgi:VWFA-related protein
MRIRFLSIITLILSLFILAAAQQPPSPPAGKQQTGSTQKQEASQKNKDDVVRISVTLVQVDAVVTDAKGRYVTDLKPEDFELIVDGRAQHITNFSFVETERAEVTEANLARDDKAAPPVPPARLRPDQVRRTIALVVDDLNLTFTTVESVKYALKKFVDEQMQPGDLVAIIRTAAGMGALQQFTTDKRQLYAAIERVRWYPLGGGRVSEFTPLSLANDTLTGAGSKAGADLESLRASIYAVGTLGALNFIVRGLKELPGRKSIVLMSNGFQLPFLGIKPKSSFSLQTVHTNENYRLLDSLRLLIDQANRASVVIYTIDARGIVVPALTAEDDVSNSGVFDNKLSFADRSDVLQAKVEAALQDRHNQLIQTQDSLKYLAYETGGFLYGSNDIGHGIKRVLEDQKGYYLLGYAPEEGTFKTGKAEAKFHKIAVRVKRAGLRVRSRTGFLGMTDEEARPSSNMRARQLFDAVTSPFNSGEVSLRLTSLFTYERKKGASMRSLLHIDTGDLMFSEGTDGWRRASIDILAITFGDNGRVVDEVIQPYMLSVKNEDFARDARGPCLLAQHSYQETGSIPVANSRAR